MQVDFEKLGPCQAKISFTVPSEEFESEVSSALKRIGQNTQMKGFRPGKIPVAVIEKKYGSDVRREARDHFLHRAVDKAVEENELRLLRHPVVPAEEGTLLVGQDLSLEVEVALRPEVELETYKGLEIESHPTETRDEDVEAMLAQVADRHARPEPAGEEGLPGDGMAVCSMALLHGEEVLVERDGLRLSPKSAPPGINAAVFEEAMAGQTVGATVEIPMTFPEDWENSEAAGQPGTCRLKLQEVFRIVRPDTEELARILEVEDEAAIREKIREQLTSAAAEREERRVEEAILTRLATEHEFDLPESMVEEQTASRLGALEAQMAQEGQPPEAVQEQISTRKQAVREEAERATRTFFLIEAIAQKEGLLVSEEDLSGEMKGIATRNGVSPKEVEEYYREQNLLSQLVMEILDRKVRQFLRDASRLVEPK